MKKTIVVRPSERAADLDGKRSYQEIKEDGAARGFAASPDMANDCDHIVVVKDDGTEAFVADVCKATRTTLPSKKTRSDIVFKNVKVYPKASIPAAISRIKWTSNNVRYSDWTP